MRPFATRIALLMVLVGCSDESAPSSTPRTSVEPVPDPQAEPGFYSEAELEALGFELTVVPGGKRACRLTETHEDQCFCLEPLDCSGPNGCATYDRNVAAFREALARTGDPQVFCERAEIGTCDDLRYFDFVGDIHRDELRFFDASGALVAQRNSTDYDAYCGGSFAMWTGRIPKCAPMTRSELICGQGPHPLVDPPSTLAR